MFPVPTRDKDQETLTPRFCSDPKASPLNAITPAQRRQADTFERWSSRGGLLYVSQGGNDIRPLFFYSWVYLCLCVYLFEFYHLADMIIRFLFADFGTFVWYLLFFLLTRTTFIRVLQNVCLLGWLWQLFVFCCCFFLRVCACNCNCVCLSFIIFYQIFFYTLTYSCSSACLFFMHVLVHTYLYVWSL